MAFVKKNWKDRQSAYPGRVNMIPTEMENQYNLSRADEPTEAGDAFSAYNMNDLEQRIFDSVPNIPISVSQGGTGASTQQQALNNLFLSGDWTPTLTSDGNFPTYTTDYMVGKYTLFGDLCYVFFEFKVNISDAGTGTMRVIGLPYISLNAPSNVEQGLIQTKNLNISTSDGSEKEGNVIKIVNNSNIFFVDNLHENISFKWNIGNTLLGAHGVYRLEPNQM
jgi:hypothetical protein